MKVELWFDRAGPLISRGRDIKALSLPCENTERRQPSASQKESPHQTLTVLLIQTAGSRTVRKCISVIWAAQSVVYCNGSPSFGPDKWGAAVTSTNIYESSFDYFHFQWLLLKYFEIYIQFLIKILNKTKVRLCDCCTQISPKYWQGSEQATPKYSMLVHGIC